jgi:hypothetical protein
MRCSVCLPGQGVEKPDQNARETGHNGRMDKRIKDSILAVTRQGRTRDESTDWFRVATGLHYLAGLMTQEPIDFKALDRDWNRFIYHVLGGGHTITSILQYMSGKKVLPTVQSARFMAAFGAVCPEVPLDSIPFLLELNLGVARNLSKLEPGGALHEWLEARKAAVATEGGASAPGQRL